MQCRTLWNTFFELVDDSAQVAKAHSAFADSLQSQIYEPLLSTQKEMESARSMAIMEGDDASKELAKGAIKMHRAHLRYEKAIAHAAKCRQQLEEHQQLQLGAPMEDADKLAKRALLLREKSCDADEAVTRARQDLRALEETHKSLHSRLHTQELPRVMSKLQQQEHERSREVYTHLLALVELERRCVAMNEEFGEEMSARVRNVRLADDERAFVNAFCSSPLPPPPAPLLASAYSNSALFQMRMTDEAVASRAASSHLNSADLPRGAESVPMMSNNRTISMMADCPPPAYESIKTSDTDLHSTAAMMSSTDRAHSVNDLSLTMLQ